MGAEGSRCTGHERLQMGLDGRVAPGDLLLIDVEELEVLLQHKHVLRSVVAGECGHNLRHGRATAIVAMRGESVRVALPAHDVAQNPQTGDPGDVTDDEGQLEIHLHECLLHPLHVRAGALDEGFAMSQVRTQGHDRVRGAETAPEQTHGVEVSDPFAVAPEPRGTHAASGTDGVAGVSSEPPAYCAKHPGTGTRLESNLLNGITRERVTSDDAAHPRATLTDGLRKHQWRFGLGSRMRVRL